MLGCDDSWPPYILPTVLLQYLHFWKLPKTLGTKLREQVLIRGTCMAYRARWLQGGLYGPAESQSIIGLVHIISKALQYPVHCNLQLRKCCINSVHSVCWPVSPLLTCRSVILHTFLKIPLCLKVTALKSLVCAINFPFESDGQCWPYRQVIWLISHRGTTLSCTVTTRSIILI